MKEYTTEQGVTIWIVPIPMLLERIRDQNAPPPRPTYDVEFAGGDMRPVAIDADSHPEEWARWQDEIRAATDRINDLIWRATLRRSIKVTLPEDDQWIRDQAELGLIVPEDPSERREHYLLTECVGGMRDVIRIMAMAGGADIDEEALGAAEASFQNIISRETVVSMARKDRKKPE